jgi:hypothetical protein
MELGYIMPMDSSATNCRVNKDMLFPKAMLQLDYELTCPGRANNTIQALSEAVFQNISVLIYSSRQKETIPQRVKYQAEANGKFVNVILIYINMYICMDGIIVSCRHWLFELKRNNGQQEC